MSVTNERIQRIANPGRSAAMSSSNAVGMWLERQSPTRISARVTLDGFEADGALTDREAEAMMRSFADVLGFEIGARHEC